MTIHWKKLPKNLKDKIAPESPRTTPKKSQDDKTPETEGKIRGVEGSFIVELEKKAEKYVGQ